MIIRQVVKILAICIISHICFVFWIFCSEIDFQILETIFEKKYVNNDVTTMVYETTQEFNGIIVKVIYNVKYGIVDITDAYVVS